MKASVSENWKQTSAPVHKFQLDARRVLSHLDRVRLGQKGRVQPPVSVEIHPTLACNLDCEWCYYRIAHKTQLSIPFQRLVCLIDELEALGVKSITISGGGEPLLYEDIDLIIQQASSKGIQVGVVTNGTYVDSEILSALLKCKWVRVSVDVISARAFESLKRGSECCYESVIANIMTLVRSKKQQSLSPQVGLGFLIRDNNISEIKPMLDLGSALRVDNVQFRPMIGLRSKIMASPEMKRAALRWADYGPPNNLASLGPKIQNIMPSRNYQRCLVSTLISMIGADSCVYPCCQSAYQPQYKLGSLLTSSFAEIWLSEHYQNFRMNENPADHPPCRFHVMNVTLQDAIQTPTRSQTGDSTPRALFVDFL